MSTEGANPNVKFGLNSQVKGQRNYAIKVFCIKLFFVYNSFLIPEGIF